MTMTPNKRGKAIILGKACSRERMYKKKETMTARMISKIYVFFHIKHLQNSFFIAYSKNENV